MVNLPDFEDMAVVIDNITKLSLMKYMLDIEINAGESDVYKKVQTDEKFFQNGKPPSTSFVKGAYEYSGVAGELIEKRKRYAEVSASLEGERMRFELMKMKIEVWRSEQANQRLSVNV